MIRFCDKEICCVSEKEMNWQQMTDYFLDGHMDEKLYVMDDMGRFAGSVIYNSLFGMIPKNTAAAECRVLDGDKRVWIEKDYVILDENIWENGRKFFRICPNGLLPVLDKNCQLLCFAWNDEEANREIRMLDELIERKNAAGFREVYPETDSVTVYGCNELAYFFVQYLNKINMSVSVNGELWNKIGIFENAGEGILEHRNFSVFAEGCSEIQEKAEFRKSVSPEFECIDRIYEENIIRGNIKDINGTFLDVLEFLRNRQIVMLGAGDDSLNAYDLLLGYGVDICCFSSENEADIGKRIFEKRVLKRAEIIENIKNPVFIEAVSRYSAWGTGEVDFYHYIGFKRNEKYFLLKDYTEIPQNGFMHILNYLMKDINKKIVLIGDFWLSLKLGKMLEKNHENVCEQIVYCDVLKEHIEKPEGLTWVSREEIRVDDVCLLMLPGYVGRFTDAEGKYTYRESVKRNYLLAALRINSVEILDYPIDNSLFYDGIHCGQNHIQKELRVKK